MIRLLPQEVRCRLRSGVTVTHMTQCVEELVVNALDAGANCIAVRIDLPCFKIQVVDNGMGISSEQLEVIGNRYFTSKCHEIEDLENLCYFGYRGEALASLKDMAAILDITTRTRQSSQTYCKMFQRGASLSVFESTIHRPSAGTTVTVHDLFYNLPVRKKTLNESLELERIRHRMEGIAVIHPNISFSLRNDVTGHIILQTHKSSCILTAFTYLFGPGKAKSLSAVSTSHGGFQVEGYMGKEPHYNKELQFIYINGRMVLKTKIHKLINQILSKSLVFKRKASGSEGQLPVNVNSSPTKQNEKYSIFVLNIKCPLDVYDITLDPAKTLVEFKDWTVLTTSIESVVWSFLKKENIVSLADSSCLVLSPDKLAVDSEEQSTETQEFASVDSVQGSDSSKKTSCTDSNKTNDIDSVDSALVEPEHVENIGDRISTHNMIQSLHSQMVTRITCIKDGQNKTKETEDNQYDRSVELDSADIGNSPDDHDSPMLSVSTCKGDANCVSLTSELSSSVTSVSWSPSNDLKSTVNSISIPDTESKETDSDLTTAASSADVVYDSCLKTPNRPTLHVCVSPEIAVVPSTTTCSQIQKKCNFIEKIQNNNCDSDVEIEDPLISPMKIQCTKKNVKKLNINVSQSTNGRNQNMEIEKTGEGNALPCSEDPHGLEQMAVTNSFKLKIQETLSQFSRKTSTQGNKITHITLTPEKRKASRSFRQRISENLAAGGFIDPSFKKVNDPLHLFSNTGQIKQNTLNKPNPVLWLENKINIGQGDVDKNSSTLGLNIISNSKYINKDQDKSGSLIQPQNVGHFSVTSCRVVKQGDRSQKPKQPYNKSQNTVTTQTSPDLHKHSTEKMDIEFGARKRVHPPCRSSSVASKLSKLVQANVQKKTKVNGSGIRSRFMTSTSFFETPRTVFAKLSAKTGNAVSGSETTVDVGNRREVQDVNGRLNVHCHKQTGEQSGHVDVCGTRSKNVATVHCLHEFSRLTGKQSKEPCGVKLNSGKLEVLKFVMPLHSDKQDDGSDQNNTKISIDLQTWSGCKNNQYNIQKSNLMDINACQINALYDQNSVQNLSIIHADADDTNRQTIKNMSFTEQNAQRTIDLDNTGISRKMLKDISHFQNNIKEPDGTIEQVAELRSSTMLPEASQGFDVTNQCEKNEKPSQSPVCHSQGFDVSASLGTIEEPSQIPEYHSLGFDAPCRPAINSDPSQSPELHSLGFSLSPPEYQTIESVEKINGRHSCEIQQCTPPVRMDETDELVQKSTSLFCDIFTPVESRDVNLHTGASLDSQDMTNNSQELVVSDGLSSEISCGQRNKSYVDLCETSDPSPLNSLLSKLSEITESSSVNCSDKQALENLETSPSSSGVAGSKDQLSSTVVDKSTGIPVKPDIHMGSALVHINTSSVITMIDITTVKPHTFTNTSVLSAKNSTLALDKNCETATEPQTNVDSHMINVDNSRVTPNTDSDTTAKTNSVVCTNASRQPLYANNNASETHVSVNSVIYADSSNVTDRDESNTGIQMESLNCSDISNIAEINISSEFISRPHTQMNSLNATSYSTDAHKEPHIQTNDDIQMEYKESSDMVPLVSSSTNEGILIEHTEGSEAVPLVSSSQMTSDIPTGGQTVCSSLNRTVATGGNKTEPQQVIDDQTCHDGHSGKSLMRSAVNAENVKPSTSEMWSPDSLLDSAEVVETGSGAGVHVNSSSVPNYARDPTHTEGKEQIQELWKNVEDPKTAGTLYVNILTGNTMSVKDWHRLNAQDVNEQGPSGSGDSSNIAALLPSERLKLREMLTSHLEESSEDRGVKWRSHCSLQSTDSGDISSLFSSWSNPVFEKPKQEWKVTRIFPYLKYIIMLVFRVALNAEVHHDTVSANKCFQSLYPTRFTKKMLQDVKVLGQIDNKFIACVLKTDDQNTSQAPSLIVLVDQHAAHERVRLEQLTDDLYMADDDADDCSIKQFPLTPPKSVHVTDEELRLMKSFRSEIKRIGITFTCSSSDKNHVNIHTVPMCLFEREASERRRKRDSVVMEIVEVLLKEHIQLLKNTGGARSQLPQTLHKVLCSQACHGAVKFGDALTLDECVQLIENLSTCSLPFQCAHGRPSVTPLIDLAHLKSKLPTEKVQRPNLWKISRNLDIHK